MANKAKRHVHRYRKIKLSYTLAWACALPDCTHRIPVADEESILGKFSICWQCGEQFILNNNSLLEDNPRCSKCKLGLENEENTPLTEKMKAFLEGRID